MEIDNESLFKKYLKKGINLFTGAGFSVLPDKNGEKLPDASGLSEELKNRYPDLLEGMENDLPILSSLIPEQELQQYLRERFKVTSCNDRYFLLNRINIKSYITTNIDNIIYHAVSGGNRYYLYNINQYGSARGKQAELEYIPLHGEVMNNTSKLFFQKFDLSIVDKINQDLFRRAESLMLGKPVLFWGYSFHDSGVLKTVQNLIKHDSYDIWVQCRKSDKKTITLFRRLGCNVIVADTDELFDWIEKNTNEFEEISSCSHNDSIRSNLSKYLIPSIKNVPAIPSEDYIARGNTQWYSVITKAAIETAYVNRVLDAAVKSKNTIIVGTDFSGKTTILMQCALKLGDGLRLFVDYLSKDQAEFIVRTIRKDSEINSTINDDGYKVTVFVDNCSSDIEAYAILANAAEIQTIAAAPDYSFEAAKHILPMNSYSPIYINDMDMDEARRFYEKLPDNLRNPKFSYKDVNDTNERYSMLEMVLKNVRGTLKKEHVKEILKRVKAQNEKAFEVIALASYLSANDSALSTDIMFSYFNLDSYEEVKRLVEIASGYLREANTTLVLEDQDYYQLRSGIFLYYACKILEEDPDLRVYFANVVRNFVLHVPSIKICNYFSFRRKAYDARFFYRLFKSRAEELYSYLFDYERNPYTLQQWALCLSKLKKYKSAFVMIDKALSYNKNNFSMKNSKAIILFEANMNDESQEALNQMHMAMALLEECYRDDKRKVYHAIEYARFAVYLYDNFSDEKYIKQGKKWLQEIIDREEASKIVKKEMDRLEECERKMNTVN